MATRPNSTESILLYESQDGTIRLDVRMDDETVWLSLDQMATLFGKSRTTVNEHVLHIYEEGELREEETKRKIGISDFSTKPTNFYNLDVIISVGYRVKSQQGTRFRQWTDGSRTHLLPGECFAPDDGADHDEGTRQGAPDRCDDWEELPHRGGAPSAEADRRAISGLRRSPSSSSATDVYEGLDRAPRAHPHDE